MAIGILDDQTRRQIYLLLGGVFLFNGVIRIPIISGYLDKYPIIFIGISIILVYFAVNGKKK